MLFLKVHTNSPPFPLPHQNRNQRQNLTVYYLIFTINAIDLVNEIGKLLQ